MIRPCDPAEQSGLCCGGITHPYFISGWREKMCYQYFWVWRGQFKMLVMIFIPVGSRKSGRSGVRVYKARFEACGLLCLAGLGHSQLSDLRSQLSDLRSQISALSSQVSAQSTQILDLCRSQLSDSDLSRSQIWAQGSQISAQGSQISALISQISDLSS